MVGATQSHSTKRRGKHWNSTTTQQQKSCCSLQQAITLFYPHQKFNNSPGHAWFSATHMWCASNCPRPFDARWQSTNFIAPYLGGYPYCTFPCNYSTITNNFSASVCSQFINFFFRHAINFTWRRTPSHAHTLACTLKHIYSLHPR